MTERMCRNCRFYDGNDQVGSCLWRGAVPIWVDKTTFYPSVVADDGTQCEAFEERDDG